MFIKVRGKILQPGAILEEKIIFLFIHTPDLIPRLSNTRLSQASVIYSTSGIYPSIQLSARKGILCSAVGFYHLEQRSSGSYAECGITLFDMGEYQPATKAFSKSYITYLS